MNCQLFKPINTINLTSNIKILNIFFKSCNFSITKSNQNDTEYLLSLRFVNYTTENGPNVNINNQGIYISANKIFKLTKDFQIIDENKLIIPPLLKEISKNINKYNKNIIGTEDIKIFNFNDTINIIGTCQDQFGNIKSITGEYIYHNNEINNFKYINVNFNKQQIEKNWVYFKNFNNELKIIYKWYPLQICEINSAHLNVVREQNMPPFFKNGRGSSCGVKYNNQLWFVVHFNINGNYSHFFAVFDMNMKLKKFSKNFKFNGAKIEFCIGLYIDDNNNFLIPYSINDTHSFLGIYNLSMINSLPWRFV